MTMHRNFHYVVSPFIYNMDTVEEKRKEKGMFMLFVKIYKLLDYSFTIIIVIIIKWRIIKLGNNVPCLADAAIWFF